MCAATACSRWQLITENNRFGFLQTPQVFRSVAMLRLQPVFRIFERNIIRAEYYSSGILFERNNICGFLIGRCCSGSWQPRTVHWDLFQSRIRVTASPRVSSLIQTPPYTVGCYSLVTFNSDSVV